MLIVHMLETSVRTVVLASTNKARVLTEVRVLGFHVFVQEKRTFIKLEMNFMELGMCINALKITKNGHLCYDLRGSRELLFF